MIRKLVECVPNFSEGRRPEVLAAIVDTIKAHSGVFLLGQEMDTDHNRAVVTLVGEPAAVKAALFEMIKKATELIDLTKHTGAHPRIGATDVVPFVPIANMTMAECVQLARDLGQRVGEELQIPVYLYEEAATCPERRNLTDIRTGQFEGLRAELGRNPERVPDYGPNRIHPTAGATVIGARRFLIAYNVNLNSQDVALAKRIAKTLRASSGGLPCVKALGLELHAQQCVQVSMNLTDYTVTSPATVYTAIQHAAAKVGVTVRESELVGFVPRQALTEAARDLLQLRDFDASQILENRMAQVVTESQASERLEDFLAMLASAEPAPGGGSASALAGSLAGALATMVCNLTVSKPKYQAVAAELTPVRAQAQQLQQRLYALIAEDTQAYQQVVSAYKLPKASESEKAARAAAIQAALKIAAQTPLEVMRQALEVLKLTVPLVEKGNPNAITDLGCAMHLANAAIAGAELNVQVNLRSITDEAFTTRAIAEVTHIRNMAHTLTQQVLASVDTTLR